MDTNLMEVLSKGGTVIILVYLLLQILIAYRAQSNRITDMLENEIGRDNKTATGDHAAIVASPSISVLMDIPNAPQNPANRPPEQK